MSKTFSKVSFKSKFHKHCFSITRLSFKKKSLKITIKKSYIKFQGNTDHTQLHQKKMYKSKLKHPALGEPEKATQNCIY